MAANYPPRDKLYEAIYAATTRSDNVDHPVDVMAAVSSATETITAFLEALDAAGLTIAEKAAPVVRIPAGATA